MSRFSAMKSQLAERAAPGPVAVEPGSRVTGRSNPREGKKAVSGYFSPEVSRGLHLLALEQGTSLQALMGEAFDDLMRKYGKHPFGER